MHITLSGSRHISAISKYRVILNWNLEAPNNHFGYMMNVLRYNDVRSHFMLMTLVQNLNRITLHWTKICKPLYIRETFAALYIMIYEYKAMSQETAVQNTFPIARCRNIDVIWVTHPFIIWLERQDTMPSRLAKILHPFVLYFFHTRIVSVMRAVALELCASMCVCF